MITNTWYLFTKRIKRETLSAYALTKVMHWKQKVSSWFSQLHVRYLLHFNNAWWWMVLRLLHREKSGKIVVIHKPRQTLPTSLSVSLYFWCGQAVIRYTCVLMRAWYNIFQGAWVMATWCGMLMVIKPVDEVWCAYYYTLYDNIQYIVYSASLFFWRYRVWLISSNKTILRMQTCFPHHRGKETAVVEGLWWGIKWQGNLQRACI